MDQLVDLNEASAAELMQLPGIGPGLAARIIAYRQEHPIRTAGQLVRIPGISARMAADLVPLVKLESDREDDAVAGEPAGSLATADAPPEPDPSVPHESWAGVSLTPELDDEPSQVEFQPALAPELTDVDEAEMAAEPAEVPAQPAPAAADAPHESWSGVSLTPELDDEPVAAEVAGAHLADVNYTDGDGAAVELAASPEENEGPVAPEPSEPEPEPVLFEPTQAANEPAPTPDVRQDAASLLQLTGCRGPLIGLFGGAIFGTLLTLLLLFIFNGGSLLFADVERVNNLSDQQTELQGEIDSLQGSLGTAEAEQGELQEALDASAAAQGQLRATITYMETRVEGVGPAAERLDSFILGMREFLNELATPPRPTMTPFATNTPATGTAATPADTTRTPRPTFTPLATPTP